eukprot:11349611-Heterocapsa_arctica.AAC.4
MSVHVGVLVVEAEFGRPAIVDVAHEEEEGDGAARTEAVCGGAATESVPSEVLEADLFAATPQVSECLGGEEMREEGFARRSAEVKVMYDSCCEGAEAAP